MDRYFPADKAMWTGRIDSHSDAGQFRVHQVVKTVDIREISDLSPGVFLLGYACDEGVRRNKGKVGAVEGPKAFRIAFSNLAAHELSTLHDLGDIICEDDQLELTQSQFSKAVAGVLRKGHKLVAIGGGHDIAYAHFMGIRAALGEKASIGIINFDAHFDLREVEENSSSGTPFWQIAQKEENFHYCCIGIQPAGNTKKLFDVAEENEVLVIERNNMGNPISERKFNEFIDTVDYLYLTIDLDGFDMSYCPGVSAPTVNGFSYQELWPYLMRTISSNKLVSMDIAELNPTFDTGQQTSKMAASLAFDVVYNWS